MEKIKKNNKSQYEIEIRLTAEETRPYIDRALAENAKRADEPGFRKGKMPVNMYVKKYGEESAYPEAIDLIVNDIYPRIIEENNLEVVDYPHFDWTKVKMGKDGFEVKGTVDVLPEFDLPDYQEIKKSIKKPEAKVTKKEVKQEIDSLLAKDAKYEAKEDYAAKSGDIVVIDFEGFVDDVAFEGGKGESYSLTLGSGTFIPGFEEQLVGAKAGDTLEVEVTFPENYQSEDLKGADAIFKTTVHEVQKRTLPRLTDKKVAEFEGYGAKNKEELESAIEEQLKAQKAGQVEVEYEDEVINKVVKAAKLHIPQGMIDQETNHAIENLEQNFKAQGIELDMYLQMTGSSLDDLKGQFNDDSKKRIETHLIIDKIMKESNVEVSDKEVDERLKKLSKDYSMSEEEILKQIGGDTEAVKRDLQFEKARDLLFK